MVKIWKVKVINIKKRKKSSNFIILEIRIKNDKWNKHGMYLIISILLSELNRCKNK